MDKNITGRFIAELRKQKGFTQKELAEKLMVTEKAISRWETGKGLPDTSLLKPLGDVLGVSITELLSGKRIEEVDMKEQADNIILESLNYSKRMLASVISVIIFIIGIAFIISPLFLVSQSYIWTLGLIIVAIAILYIYTRKKRNSMKATNRAYHLSALALQGIALILEILPIGTVMVFATSPTKQTIEVYSYFSLLPVGYANFTPLLTGILTILIILLGAIALFKFDNAASLRKAMFVCSVISLLLSIVPLFLFGTVGMTAASYAVSCAILLSICYPAKAGTKVVQPVPPRSAASFSSERVNK